MPCHACICYDVCAVQYVGGAEDKKVADMYGLYMMSLLARGEVNEARLVWKRVPAGARDAAPELQRIWALALAAAAGEHAAVYARLRPAPAAEWPPHLQAVAAAYRALYRQNALHTLSRAYANVSAEAAMAQCDLSAAELQAGEEDTSTHPSLPPSTHPSTPSPSSWSVSNDL
jgi:hypothetical protein